MFFFSNLLHGYLFAQCQFFFSIFQFCNHLQTYVTPEKRNSNAIGLQKLLQEKEALAKKLNSTQKQLAASKLAVKELSGLLQQEVQNQQNYQGDLNFGHWYNQSQTGINLGTVDMGGGSSPSKMLIKKIARLEEDLMNERAKNKGLEVEIAKLKNAKKELTLGKQIAMQQVRKKEHEKKEVEVQYQKQELKKEQLGQELFETKVNYLYKNSSPNRNSYR